MGLQLVGQKRWCSGGGHSDLLVLCRMDESVGAKGLGAVYVPSDAIGVSYGAAETLMGFRGIPSADIFFDDVVVPEASVVLRPGEFGKMMQAFCLERCGNAIMSLAQAQATLDDVLAYVQEREQFGKPLVEFQAVQLRLADMQMKITAARLLIYAAVARADARAHVSGELEFPSVSIPVESVVETSLVHHSVPASTCVSCGQRRVSTV
eukprot:SAG11_NODE_2967_length_2805_cov_1.906135_2_plen_208_part_00